MITEMAIKENRGYTIDLLKSIAIIGVIFIHISGGGYQNGIGTFNWTASVFWGSLTRASVPLFLMCSGALLLNPTKELTLKKLFTKNLLRIIIAMLFWAMAYKCFHLLVAGTFSIQSLFQSLKEVLVFRQEFHLYYLHIIILVYLFLPVTRILVCNASKRQLQYALAVWFVFGILYPTVKPFWPFTLLDGIPAQWFMNMTYGSIGYGILGYYLKTYPLQKKSGCAALFLVGFGLVFGWTWRMSVEQGVLYEHFYESTSIAVFLMATGIFGLCVLAKNRSSGSVKTVVSYLSKASFCIYLVHVFFIYIFNAVGFDVGILPCIVSIPMVVGANLLCSCGVYSLLSRIPVVEKWLI